MKHMCLLNLSVEKEEHFALLALSRSVKSVS